MCKEFATNLPQHDIENGIKYTLYGKKINNRLCKTYFLWRFQVIFTISDTLYRTQRDKKLHIVFFRHSLLWVSVFLNKDRVGRN